MKTKKPTGKNAPIIISVGGSLIVPDSIDSDFLISLKELVHTGIKAGERFIIICGGGKTARRYQDAGKAVAKLRSSDIDWLGIHSTRLNAQLVKTVLFPEVEEVIVHDPFDKSIKFNKSILIAAGWKPGFSTDFDAVCLAKRYKAKKLINLSNIDYVYTKDPRTNPDATKIEKISWKAFRRLIPKKWDPGLSSPFDPIASKEAEVLGLEVAIINGTHLEEINKFIQGLTFVGTLIK
jgi:uridylate kinase